MTFWATADLAKVRASFVRGAGEEGSQGQEVLMGPGVVAANEPRFLHSVLPTARMMESVAKVQNSYECFI